MNGVLLQFDRLGKTIIGVGYQSTCSDQYLVRIIDNNFEGWEMTNAILLNRVKDIVPPLKHWKRGAWYVSKSNVTILPQPIGYLL